MRRKTNAAIHVLSFWPDKDDLGADSSKNKTKRKTTKQKTSATTDTTEIYILKKLHTKTQKSGSSQHIELDTVTA